MATALALLGAAPEASAQVVHIVSPASGSTIASPGGPVSVTVDYTLSGWTLAPGGNGLLWYLDGTLDGTQYAQGPYTYASVPKGVHRLTVVPVDAQGTPVDAARDSISLAVAPPCTSNADCDDANPCSVEACRPAASGNRCSYVALPAATCCASSFDCAVGQTCSATQCVQCTADADCDDANPCTADTCAAGTCTHAAVSGCCLTDGDCDDGNACTADSCDAATHTCQHTPQSGGACCTADADCDDGNPCTVDACSPLHLCRHSAPVAGCCQADADCDDANPCTVDACDVATGTCQHSAAAAAPGCCASDADCNDGHACTTDTCDPGTHTCQHDPVVGCCELPADCDDANPCTVDRCIANACAHLPHPALPGCCTADADCPDDGDPCTVAVCANNLCVQDATACPAPLPWKEDFGGADLAAASMTATATNDTPRWGLVPGGAWARLTLDAPAGQSVEQVLTGPLLDAFAASAPVTLVFRSRVQGVDSTQAATLEVRLSTDGGTTWTVAWQRTLAAGDVDWTAEVVDASALAGHNEVRVAFECTGACTGGGTWDVDMIRLGEGLAPVAQAVADSNVPENAADVVMLSATDADTAAASLHWTLVDRPAFAHLLLAPAGGAVILSPHTGDVGTYTVRGRVSDGFFYDELSFGVTVTPAPAGTGGGGGGGGGGGVALVIIRDAAGGAGNVVGDRTVSPGDTLALYAAGYDALGQYVQDVPVLWETTGGLEPVPQGPSSSVVVSFPKGDVSGVVRAAPPNPDILGDQTGLITVLPGPPASASGPDSVLVASKAALVANGTDELTLSVLVRDANGQPYDGNVTVTFATSAGSLVGSVTKTGTATWSQTLRASSTPATATVTATVDGQPVGNTLQIPIQTVIDLVANGITVIDCNNYADYAGADLLIANGTVEIDSAQCAPMVFGDVTVGNGGVLTHAAASGASTERIDIEVDSFTVLAGGLVDVTGKGWPAGTGYEGLADFAPCNHCGGSHGGLGGGSAWSSAVPKVHDRLDAPLQPGGGGAGAAGGGVVHVRVAKPDGAAVVFGTIRANGAGSAAGGGAGGSIWLDTPILSGQGRLEANGGDGNSWCGSYCSGGGGGGRVAVTGVDILSGAFSWSGGLTGLHARGGTGWNHGGAGTIFVRRTGDAYGNLLVDNEGASSAADSTPLLVPGQGDWEIVTATGLSDYDHAALPADYATGYWLRVDTAANATPTLLDDPLVRILGNDSWTFAPDTDPTSLTAAGKSYEPIYRFDNLEVRGNAHLHATGGLVVLDGDISSGDTASLSIDGSVTCDTFEGPSLEHVIVTNGRFEAPTLVTFGVVDHTLDLTATQSTVVVGNLVAGILDLDGSTLQAQDVTATGDVAATNSQLNATTLTVAGDLTWTGGSIDAPVLSVTGVGTLQGAAVVDAENVTATSLVLQGNNTVLRHPATVAGQPFEALHVVASNVTVGAGAAIDVSGRGWTTGVSYGGVATFASAGNSGGSHGGLGGYDGWTNAVGPAYDRVDAPAMPGAGGGASNGAAGGGVIRLEVATTLAVEGAIRANGGGNARAGGAGGSIWITASTLTGQGSIEARGGQGNAWCGSYCSGGGGGGRIAIEYDTLSAGFAWPDLPGHVRAEGGNGWHPGGAGTIYLRGSSQTWGDLLVDNAGKDARADSTPLPAVGTGTATGVTAAVLADASKTWIADVYAGTSLHKVDEGDPATLADDTVFDITANTATELTLAQDPSAVLAVGDAYAALWTFDNLEVRGKARLYVDGDLRVVSGDAGSGDATTLVVTGDVHAGTLDIGGVTRFEVHQGTLDAARLLGGGTENPALDWVCDGGTVTLPAVVATGLTATNSTLTAPSIDVSGDATLAGSTTTTDSLHTGTNLTVDGGALVAPQLHVGQVATLQGGAAVDAESITATSLVLQGNNTVLRHPATVAGQPFEALHVVASNVTVGAGAAIDVSGRGWTTGVSYGGVTTYGSAGNSGGSHGGLGGYDGWSNAVGPAYDRVDAPAMPGAGGGASNGAAGGGVIRLEVATTLTVEGAIRANGGGNARAGGAGGSIWITTSALTGQGSIEARGGQGNAWCGSYCSGGGGGGRIAIEYDALAAGFAWPDLPGHVHAEGGNGWHPGGAGTIYLRGSSQTWGDLLVDNAGKDARADSTPLPAVGTGTVTGVTAAGLTDASKSWIADLYVGTSLHKVDEGDPATLADDTVFDITANTATELTLAQDPTAVLAVGDAYAALWTFDNLEVRGKARLYVDGDLRVVSGDAGSGDATTLVVTGDVHAGTLDLGGVTRFEVHQGTLDVARLLGGGTENPALDWVYDGGAVKLPAVVATGLTATNTTLTAPSIDVSGDVTLTGSTTTTDSLHAGANLTVDGGTLVAPQLDVAQVATLQGGAAVDAESVTATSLVLQGNNTVLRHPATVAGQPFEALHVVASNVTVGAGAAIDVSGRGWTTGVSYGGVSTFASAGNTGGSHGGVGGYDAWTNTVAPAYDRLDAPAMPGAGGGGTYGAAGGGVIRLEVATTLAVEGAIRANGAGNARGGGAGGSIWITTSALTGQGSIEARGGQGNAWCGSYCAGGGGGGRIAIEYDALAAGFAWPDLPGHVHAEGGNGWQPGGAGTIYLRGSGQTWGDLLVDNAGKNAAADSTPLPAVGTGTATGVTATALADASKNWIADLYAGTSLHEVDEGDPATLADDTVFDITANTATELTLAQDPSAVLAVGDGYAALWTFDNLEVRGQARLYVDGDLRVVSGDASSGDATTLVVTGDVHAGTLDLGGVTRFEVHQGTLDVARLLGGGTENPALDWVYDGGAVTLPAVVATGLTATNTTLTAPSIDVSGDATLTGSTTTTDSLHAGANLTVDGGTLVAPQIHVAQVATLQGGAAVDAESVTATSLVLQGNNTVLRHPATVAGQPFEALHVVASNVTVGAGAAIDVSGRGWTTGVSYGGVSTFASAGNTGGSHGGLGGYDAWTNTVAPAYDRLDAPAMPGAGGGASNGAAGGGVIRLEVATTLAVEGAIRANGAGNARAGGAGGSIWITTSALTGQGSIEARGGQGNAWCGSYCSGGGGGGRIAIEYDALAAGFAWPDLPGHVHAEGGNGWQPGGAGTIYLRGSGQTWGDLLVDNAGKNAAADSTPLPAVGTGTATGVTAAVLADASKNWIADLYAGTSLHEVDEGDPATLADDTVLDITANTATELTLAQDPTTVLAVGDAYAALWTFDNLEVRGKARLYVDGDLRVVSGDASSGDATTLVVTGDVHAGTLDLGGVTRFEVHQGTLDVARLLGGGTENPALDWVYDGGAVTLPAVVATGLTATNTTLTAPSIDVSGDATLAGSTTTTDSLHAGANLTVDGGTLVAPQLDVAQVATLQGGAAVDAENVTATSLVLQGNNTVLRHPATVAGQPFEALHVVASNVTVGAGAAIDVSGRGWTTGVSYGGVSTFASAGNTGGSHGGLGGYDAWTNTVAPAYDRLDAPAMPGAGGGGTYGAAGGGVIRLEVATTLAVEGAIRANGAGNARGGGAGGSIWITTSALTGQGSIEARGGQGNAWCGSYCSGGGGGGRIAIEYDALAAGFAWPDLPGHVHAEGGNGWQPGGAGTIYLRGSGQTWGDLLVDNAGKNAAADSTPLPAVGTGTATAVTAAVLADASKNWIADLYAGTSLHEVDEGDPATLADDTVFDITANTATELTLAQDPSALLAVGDAYAALWTFDNLEVRGKARLYVDGDLRVVSGDATSGDATTLVVTGDVHADTLDLGGVTRFEVHQGTLDVARLLGGGTENPALDWLYDGSTVTLPAVVATGLTATNTTLTAPSIDVSGDAALTGATTTTDSLHTGANLTVDGGALVAPQLDVAQVATLQGGAAVDAENVTVTSLVLQGNNTVLRHPATVAGQPFEALHVVATNVTVASGAAIDVSGRGWPTGVSFGGVTTYGSAGNTGGSHGGLGGYDAWNDAVGPAYDRFDAPAMPGAGGGGTYGAAGGGVIRLEVATALAVDGAIRANGAGNARGGGAGGSIWITTSALTGQGSIEARGGQGNAWCGSYCSGGGGGGRIAIEYDVLAAGFAWPDLPSHVHAEGGGGWHPGGAGTVYLLDSAQTWGDLLVDNAGKNAAADSTPLPSIGEGSISSLTPTTLADTTKLWIPNDFYVGYMVNPNVSQGGTATRTDDQFFVIASHTASELTVTSGDLTTVAAQGDTYRGIFVFDHLEIRGNAKVATTAPADFLVLSGDLHSATQAFDVPSGSTLTGAVIELPNLSQADITGSITATDALLCTDCP